MLNWTRANVNSAVSSPPSGLASGANTARSRAIATNFFTILKVYMTSACIQGRVVKITETTAGSFFRSVPPRTWTGGTPGQNPRVCCHAQLVRDLKVPCFGLERANVGPNQI